LNYAHRELELNELKKRFMINNYSMPSSQLDKSKQVSRVKFSSGELMPSKKLTRIHPMLEQFHNNFGIVPIISFKNVNYMY